MTTFKPCDEMVCLRTDGYEYSLTEGKTYICLNGTEEGIFADRPFVSFIGDDGREYQAHASRF